MIWQNSAIFEEEVRSGTETRSKRQATLEAAKLRELLAQARDQVRRGCVYVHSVLIGGATLICVDA